MNFIDYTISWVKGEIFEAFIFGAFGLLTIICSFLFWKFGETTNAKAMVIPFLIVGFFFLVTAVFAIISNSKRLAELPVAYQKDKIAFVKSEKVRVEGFQYLYKVTTIIAAICFALAIGLFFFTKSSVLLAIALALIMFGFSGLTIDFFSKERADNYYKAVLKEL